MVSTFSHARRVCPIGMHKVINDSNSFPHLVTQKGNYCDIFISLFWRKKIIFLLCIFSVTYWFPMLTIYKNLTIAKKIFTKSSKHFKSLSFKFLNRSGHSDESNKNKYYSNKIHSNWKKRSVNKYKCLLFKKKW